MTNVRRIIVSVSDLDRSLGFYAEALGLSVLWSNEEVATLDADGVEVMLHRRTPTPGDRGIAATFGVDDVDARSAAAVAAGAELVRAPGDEAWGERQAVLHDPDGHLICLVAPLGDAAA